MPQALSEAAQILSGMPQTTQLRCLQMPAQIAGDRMSDDDIAGIQTPTGVPLLHRLDAMPQPIGKRQLDAG